MRTILEVLFKYFDYHNSDLGYNKLGENILQNLPLNRSTDSQSLWTADAIPHYIRTISKVPDRCRMSDQ
jgi:hypothetical protein